jgi:hypothetical protein
MCAASARLWRCSSAESGGRIERAADTLIIGLHEA